jgi:type IV pilus assembly protein PilF
MRASVKRCVLFVLLAAAVVGCATGGTKTGDSRDLTQKQQASQINAQLGTDYFRQGNWEEAKLKLERALDQDPRNVQAQMVGGMLYMQLGERDKAETHLRKAVSLDDKNPDTHNTLAAFLCRYGKFEEGEKHALIAAAEPLYKSPESALYNAGNCARGHGDLPRAEAHFRKAIELQPRFAPALFELADLEFRSGEFLIARAFLERHNQVAQPSPASLLLAVRIETALGNKSLAADYARRLRNDFTTSDEAKALAAFERSGH